MKTATAALVTLGILGFPSLANASMYLNWSSKEVPQIMITANVTPGTTTTATFTNWQRDIELTSPNACGYKSVSAGANADGFQSLEIPGFLTTTTAASLPVFDGNCNANSATLIPKTEGAAVPTSHYVGPDGKRLFIKVPSGATYARITTINQVRNLKADACGNYVVRFPTHKEGRTAFSMDTQISIPGFASFNPTDLGNQGPVAICSRRWVEGQSGSFRREPRLMVEVQ